MSSRKREFYARCAVQLRTHDRPSRAEKACPGAMGLYLFLLLQARGEESDGEVSELVALTGWSAPVAYRKKQLEALVTAGLVERGEEGWLVVVRYADHNDGKADIDAAREAARNRKSKSRSHADVTRDSRVSHAEVPISISVSLSDLSLVRDPEPTSTPREVDEAGTGSDAPSAGPPDWWPGAVSAAEQVVGDIPDSLALWVEYDAARYRKGWAKNHRDAVGWLTSVRRSAKEREASRPAPSSRTRNADRQPHDEGWLKRMRVREQNEAAAGTGTDDPFGGST